MNGGEIAFIYAVMLFIGFFGGAWVYSRYLKYKGAKI